MAMLADFRTRATPPDAITCDWYACGQATARDEHDRLGYRVPFAHGEPSPSRRRMQYLRAVEWLSGYRAEYARLVYEDAMAGHAEVRNG